MTQFPTGDDGSCKFYEKPDFSRKYNIIKTKEAPNMDVFSEKELTSIESVLNEFGHLSGIELSDLSHKDCAWTKSRKNRQIDYKLFFQDNPEKNKHAYEAMLSELEDNRFIDDL